MAKQNYYVLPGVDYVNGRPVPADRVVLLTAEEAAFDLFLNRIVLGSVQPPGVTPEPAVANADVLRFTRDGRSLSFTIAQLVAFLNLGGGTILSDTITGTDKTWSSQKIVDAIAALKLQITGPNVSAALDTLKEIGDALADDDTAIAAISTGLAKRLRFDAAQILTSSELTQARANLGAAAADDVGNVTTNFVTAFEAALA